MAATTSTKCFIRSAPSAGLRPVHAALAPAPALDARADVLHLPPIRSARASVRQTIRAVGAKLFFLPKYSPDLNPIEKFFAKLKHWLRKAARRTVDAVYHAIADILPLTSPTECSNYFAQAGYTQPQTITL